jgi:hypothetical protein
VRLYLENSKNLSQKPTGGVAQGEGSEFKLQDQYWGKKKERKKRKEKKEKSSQWC